MFYQIHRVGADGSRSMSPICDPRNDTVANLAAWAAQRYAGFCLIDREGNIVHKQIPGKPQRLSAYEELARRL